MRSVFSLFRGITIPTRDLVQQIVATGWEPGKVQFQDGSYVARATFAGEKIEKTGVTEATALANVLNAIVRKHQIRSGAQRHIGMWQTNFVDMLPQIAEAYAKAPIYDPKAAGAWKELADDSVRRAQVLGQQLQIEIVDDPEPYSSAQEMCEDVHKKRHFKVSRANAEHPVWSVDQNVAFRTVHDVMGHCVSGGDFGWQGENLACAAHFPLLSPNAQQALFSECIGQTGYATYYKGFGPQKVCYLSEFIEPAQEQENDPTHMGLHPGLSVAPTQMPGVEPSPAVGLTPAPYEMGLGPPHQVGIGTWSRIAQTTALDPNAGWSSGEDPLQLTQDPMSSEVLQPGNALNDHGDPLEFQNTKENASRINTDWHQFQKEDGSPDWDRMRQAIINAFRAVLLSPRKDLRWNTIHYQDISDIPASVNDPKVYWDRLEGNRRSWNQARGIHPEAHMPYFKFLKPFESLLYMKNQEQGPLWAHQRAQELLYEWTTQEQQRIEMEDDDKPPEKQKSADEIERRANEAVAKRMNMYIKGEFNPDTDEPSHVEQNWENQQEQNNQPQQMVLGARWDEQMAQQTMTGDEELLNKDKYGAFMGTHLKAIAQIGEHVDDILQAALDDVKQGGSGHIFRSKVLQMGISGVGPKVCSFAWLLLMPMKSELATIDTHMMDVLGHDYDKDMNNRDYFKYERELGSGRDAAGYGAMPLGQFQWGMWDYKRTGPGSHQDHSALRVINPEDHNNIDWAQKMQNVKGDDWIAPDWWANTQAARDRAAETFDDATESVPQNQYPFQYVDAQTALSKVAMVNGPAPWLYDSGNIWTGAPGQTYAQLIRKTWGIPAHEYWQQEEGNRSLGKYDPVSDELTVAAGNPDREFVHDWMRDTLRPPLQDTQPHQLL